jgi:hypothetical protein
MAFGDPDASSPANLTALAPTGAGARTFTTASFTAPLNSIIVVMFFTNSGTAADILSAWTITNSGTALSWSASTQVGNNVQDAQVTRWQAKVTVSQSMTITCGYSTASSTDNFGSPVMLRAIVVTGTDFTSNTSMIGANNKARVTSEPISTTYTSTRDNSRGWLMYADWNALGTASAGTNQTVDAHYDVASADNYATIKQNAVTTPNGSTVTVSTSAPSGTGQVSYMYFELLPALSANPTGPFPTYRPDLP